MSAVKPAPEKGGRSEGTWGEAVAAEYLGQGAVGIDLAGAEGIVPLKNFAPLFQRAAELGNEDALANVERVREKLNTKKK